MVDYFAANDTGSAQASAPVNGNAQPQTNGGGEDLGMAEISVSYQSASNMHCIRLTDVVNSLIPFSSTAEAGYFCQS